MKNIVTILVLVFSYMYLHAQDSARLKVQVNNELGKPIVGEQIIFEDKESTFLAKGISNSQGLMYVNLVGGLTYNIKIKTIGEATTYNTIKIPLLENNQRYSENLLTITILEAQSFMLDNVYFDSGNSNLKPASDKELNELYEYMRIKNDIGILISGHTDNVGNDYDNLKLSENRAKAVQRYLISKGINGNRIEIKAFGETKPIFENTTKEGRAKNRRIEVEVLK